MKHQRKIPLYISLLFLFAQNGRISKIISSHQPKLFILSMVFLLRSFSVIQVSSKIKIRAAFFFLMGPMFCLGQQILIKFGRLVPFGAWTNSLEGF